jgi:hypothetical protein
MKATIITMRLFGLQFDQIEARIGVGEPTCHRIYHRAIKDASNEDLHDMADSLSTKKHLGRERKIKNGSKLSKVIVKTYQYGKTSALRKLLRGSPCCRHESHE